MASEAWEKQRREALSVMEERDALREQVKLLREAARRVKVMLTGPRPHPSAATWILDEALAATEPDAEDGKGGNT